MSGFTSPNYTQTPNDLFDVHMKDMTEAELKVTLAIVRKTLGYHKKSDPISLTQLEEMTGLSRSACSEGVDYAIERGLIELVGTGKRGVKIYGLIVNSDQSEKATSSNSGIVDILTGSNSGIDSASTIPNFLHTKEKELKKEELKKGRGAKAPAPSKIHPLVQEWIDVRGLKIVDIGAPIGGTKYSAAAKRMSKWAQPPTSEEIRIAITSSKSAAYDFTWLETDIAKLRLEKANAAAAPINPAHVKIEPVADQDAPDRELIDTTITDLARRFSVKDEVQRVPPAA